MSPKQPKAFSKAPIRPAVRLARHLEKNLLRLRNRGRRRIGITCATQLGNEKRSVSVHLPSDVGESSNTVPQFAVPPTHILRAYPSAAPWFLTSKGIFTVSRRTTIVARSRRFRLPIKQGSERYMVRKRDLQIHRR